MFEIFLSATGDRAEADDLGGALCAAATMVDDVDEATNACHGHARRLRRTIIITRRGIYDPVATNLARDGHREALSAEWSA